MATPKQLQSGLERLAAFAEVEGRTLEEFDIVYRIHDYSLQPTASAERQPFQGMAEQIAADICQFEALGVTHLVLDFMRQSSSLDAVLAHMEAFATQVRPLVR